LAKGESFILEIIGLGRGNKLRVSGSERTEKIRTSVDMRDISYDGRKQIEGWHFTAGSRRVPDCLGMRGHH
jgi:hypothetical protein